MTARLVHRSTILEFRRHYGNPWIRARDFLFLLALTGLGSAVAVIMVQAHEGEFLTSAVKVLTFLGTVAFGHWFVHVLPEGNSLRREVAGLLLVALLAVSWGVEFLLASVDLVGGERFAYAAGRGFSWWGAYLVCYGIIYAVFGAARGFLGASRGSAPAWVRTLAGGAGFLLLLVLTVWLQVVLTRVWSPEGVGGSLVVVLAWGVCAAGVGYVGSQRDKTNLLASYRRVVEGRRRRESRLGEIAVESGLLSEPQLNRALAIQEEGRRSGRPKLLGRVLVENGFVEESVLEALLEKQRAERILDAARTAKEAASS